MGPRRWEPKPARRRPVRRRMERAVLGPAISLVVVIADRRLRKALARAR